MGQQKNYSKLKEKPCCTFSTCRTSFNSIGIPIFFVSIQIKELNPSNEETTKKRPSGVQAILVNPS